MNILIYSPAFHPRIGGLEAIMAMLAEQFVQAGHAVTVVTTTPSPARDHFPFSVLRCPSPAALLRATRWADIFFYGNISLKGLWPLLVCPRPIVASHHGLYQRSAGGELGWQDRLKRLITRFTTNISVSHAVAHRLPGRHTIIPNAYRDDLFVECPGIPRNRDLVFLGRLVSDKGVDLLVSALARLAEQGLTPNLTIIGGGPEEAALRRQVADLALTAQVTFTGPQQGQALVELLNRHRIMVVPSRWDEPFGIVALEGIACGCVVVGSRGGGLSEAIGPCGVTFPNHDLSALVTALAHLLQHPDALNAYRAPAAAHLAQHRQAAVAARYLAVFQEAVR